MSYDELYRKPYKSPCACGRGIVRYYLVTKENDFGGRLEDTTEAEILCDCCKDRFAFSRSRFGGEYLVPKGLQFQPSMPDLDSKHQYSSDERFVEVHPKTEIASMILDMTAPKHRFIKDLTYQPAIEFANKWAVTKRKKSLEPMVEYLSHILSDYDALVSTVSKKKPYVDAYHKQEQEIARMNREVEGQSFKLSFSYDEEQDNKDHEKAREDQEKYAKAHMYDDFRAHVVYHPTFKTDYAGRYWDSLSIKECVDPQFLILDKPQYGTAEITIVKRYLCVCSVCKRQLIANSSDFEILFDEEKGFYPKLSCGCHKVSSFEAKTMAILDDLGVRYAREVSFSGLNGDSGFPLRFDFGLCEKLDESGNPAYSVLIELQGPHHFKMGFYDEYGMFVEDSSEKAKRKLVKQADYDDRKSQFCAENGIPLETIKYTASKSYDDFEELIIGIASKYGLIDDDKDLPF